MIKPGEIDRFIESQLTEWELASVNYRDLGNVKTKTLKFDGFEVIVQFNPKRIVSSAAKVDARSIEARPCFLCSQNRPSQQRGLKFGNDYIILVNPFPIFPKHLTIPQEKHTPQLIQNHFEDMLDLAAELTDFVVFYNGPKCGASAPDHFHFQAGSKSFMTIEKDFHNLALRQLVKVKDQVKIYKWDHYLRNAISFQSPYKKNLSIFFDRFYKAFDRLQANGEEPMLNVLAYLDNGEWLVHLFPRKLHRPTQYFEQGEKQLLLSPASVDMGGVFITPREEDFLKIKEGDVADMLTQVCLDETKVDSLLNEI